MSQQTIFSGQTLESLTSGGCWDGLDRDASHAEFCEQLKAIIQADYPDAEIEIGTDTDRHYADGFDNPHSVDESVRYHTETLFQGGGWLVELA